MRTPRKFDEHLTLFSRYAELVDALTPDAWTRLQARCATLDGTGLDGIIDRARLAAAAQMWLPVVPNAPFVLRAIRATTKLAMVTIGLTYETITAVAPSTIESPKPRRTSTGKPRVDDYIDAGYLIDRALERNAALHGGVAAAVRSAAQAVLHHDWFPQAEFASVYRWVETEIPYRLVDADDEHSAAQGR